MDMMGDFEDQPAGMTEDPAADFLEREQGMLAEIGDEDLKFGGAPDGEEALQSGEGFGEGGFQQFSEEPAEPADPYAAITSQDYNESEAEPIRKWRVEQEQMLAEKDSRSQEELQEWLQKAQQELADWEARQDEQLSKTKQDNRAAEEAFIRERDEDTPGSEWERVGRMCDFNPKNSKNSKDMTRMRSILLHLKQTPLS